MSLRNQKFYRAKGEVTIKKNETSGASEMKIHWARACLVSSMVPFKKVPWIFFYFSRSRLILCPLLPLHAPSVHTCRENIHTHKIKQKVSPWHLYQVFTWGLLIWRHPIIMPVSGPGGFQRNNQNKTQKEATYTWGSKVSSNYKSYLWIYGWTPNCPTQDSRPLSPTCDQRVLSEVTWKNKPKEYGESKHKQVPGRIQINELQVREANGCDHSWREKHQNTVPEFTNYDTLTGYPGGWGQAPWCPFSVHQKSAWRPVQCQKGKVQGWHDHLYLTRMAASHISFTLHFL